MSAFLGPIHYWLYNKIQIQQGIIEEIVKSDKEWNLSGMDLEKELEERYGVSETRPLEEVIDQQNIHGWLQANVSVSEYKLAYAITSILKQNPESFSKLEEIFFRKGKELGSREADNDANEVYKQLSDSLLDGMPCDHANTVLENSEEQVIWKRTTCVHKSYWDEAGGDIKNYYLLREALITGYLSNSKLEYVKIDDETNMIKKK